MAYPGEVEDRVAGHRRGFETLVHCGGRFEESDDVEPQDGGRQEADGREQRKPAADPVGDGEPVGAAERIGQRRWLSTQEAAFAFVAIGKMSEADDRELKADFTSPTGAKSAVGANTGVFQIELPADSDGSSFTVKNTGTATLYASVITSGKPRPGEEQTTNERNCLLITTNYRVRYRQRTCLKRLKKNCWQTLRN